MERRVAISFRTSLLGSGDLVRDDLFGVGDDLEDRAPHRFERTALRLLEPSQILVNVFGGQSSNLAARSEEAERLYAEWREALRRTLLS